MIFFQFSRERLFWFVLAAAGFVIAKHLLLWELSRLAIDLLVLAMVLAARWRSTVK